MITWSVNKTLGFEKINASSVKQDKPTDRNVDDPAAMDGQNFTYYFIFWQLGSLSTATPLVYHFERCEKVGVIFHNWYSKTSDSLICSPSRLFTKKY